MVPRPIISVLIVEIKPPKDQRSHIFDAMAEQNYSKGDVIIKQGDPGNYFYVIGKLFVALWTI